MVASGRKALYSKLPDLIIKYKIDFVIVNGENASDDGKGITQDITKEFFKFGVDVITSGNHIWDKKDTTDFIEKDITIDFKNALIGIKMLPSVARSGVYLSYKYYLELLDKIKSKDSSTIKTERVRVSNMKKFMIFVGTYLNPA